MASKKRIAGIVLVVAAIGVAGLGWSRLNVSRSNVGDDKVTLADARSGDRAAIERG